MTSFGRFPVLPGLAGRKGAVESSANPSYQPPGSVSPKAATWRFNSGARTSTYVATGDNHESDRKRLGAVNVARIYVEVSCLLPLLVVSFPHARTRAMRGYREALLFPCGP